MNAVLEDLDARFEDMNDQTAKLEMFYNLTTISVSVIQWRSREIAEMYQLNSLRLENQINSARAILNAVEHEKFNTYQQLARFLLNELPEGEYNELRFLLSVVLVLPFSTADCERAFSSMNAIKSSRRNRLGDILRALMMIYTANEAELRLLHRDEMAKYVAHKVCTGKDSKFSASERYMMYSIV